MVKPPKSRHPWNKHTSVYIRGVSEGKSLGPWFVGVCLREPPACGICSEAVANVGLRCVSQLCSILPVLYKLQHKKEREVLKYYSICQKLLTFGFFNFWLETIYKLSMLPACHKQQCLLAGSVFYRWPLTDKS